jgi:hypothetical protein
MNKEKRFLLFFLLPLLAILSYPPATLLKGIGVILVVILVFIGFGIFLWIGKSIALTLTIFLQGLNVIIRLMMFFPNSLKPEQNLNVTYVVFSLVGLGLSLYLLLRLDRPDIRSQMIG